MYTLLAQFLWRTLINTPDQKGAGQNVVLLSSELAGPAQASGTDTCVRMSLVLSPMWEEPLCMMI